MNMLTTVNIHLEDDTRIHTRAVGNYCAITLGDDVTIYVSSHDQLIELIQACDVASKILY